MAINIWQIRYNEISLHIDHTCLIYLPTCTCLLYENISLYVRTVEPVTVYVGGIYLVFLFHFV